MWEHKIHQNHQPGFFLGGGGPPPVKMCLSSWTSCALIFFHVCIGCDRLRIYYTCRLFASRSRLRVNWFQQPPRPLLVSEAFSPRQNSHTEQVHIKVNYEHIYSMYLGEQRSGLALGCSSLSACQCGRFKPLYRCTDEGLAALLHVNHNSQQRG